MNEAAVLEPAETEGSNRLAAGRRRPPPKAVRILLPVWGYRFVRQFLEFSLPTLLAPGNIPALAKALPCRFVLMTRLEDLPLIREHPAWRRLMRTCEVEFQPVDDLITDGNHTATITLAYARAVRATGDAMLDTCFLFLVSDYIFADGALRSVLARMQAGASGVLAGNFQIVAEDAIPLLRRRMDASAPHLALNARQLVGWSLAHLHPATSANIVNFGLTHNVHTNRMFWRVDEQTLIGRFYLMHMIGVRPEVTDFVIGASCDYSFIPEMCPSNNVDVLTDSDEYLVVEMQPRDHEAKHLTWGSLTAGELAHSLSEWTTARHRENVHHTLVYHSDEIPEQQLSAVRAEADVFLKTVNDRLSSSPQPHRHHPYWIGSIASHRASTRQALNADDWAFLLGEREQRQGLARRLWRMRLALFGTPPEVTAWHPRWPDYRLPLEKLRKLGSSNARVLVVSDRPIAFANWLMHFSKDIFSIESDRLLELSRRQYMPLVGSFDICILFLSEGELKSADEFLRRVGPLLQEGGRVLLVVSNGRIEDIEGFGSSFAYHGGRLLNPNMKIEEIHYVQSSRLRSRVQTRMARLAERMRDRSRLKLPVHAFKAVVLGVTSYLCNRRALETSSEPPRRGYCSSVFVVMRPSVAKTPLPIFQHDTDLFRWEKELLRMQPAMKDNVLEHSLDLRDQQGLEPLGLRANQIWHDDPRRLGFILARYQFVARLLSGRHDVGEVGCRDAFGARVVLQDVKKITVYDSDAVFIEDVRRRFSEEWPLDAQVHDILRDRLTKTHDSIYSIDAIQHVSPEDEDNFVRHLRDSLSREHDILILGSPTPDADPRAVPIAPAAHESAPTPTNSNNAPTGTPSTPGLPIVIFAAQPQQDTRAVTATLLEPMGHSNMRPVYFRTGAALKALVERHFHAVFIFSMFDEIVLPGDLPMANYTFALCCAKKT